ncbi:hypothetical protein BK133_26455 [Paenibacillus sp. FSL H8-0548]|uniref:hypothetical protein n=1 Tax=Paenibacillus sp. FSL H8-0548 TaxID=1920422 RepID=UPI00096CD91D|nr:hypothetical protein [Paenibacillus sp. FSL H8-0548]OMF22342.1 hypothetical protein BK133_26455 [Paenibacillus sp. FSL H8-0548]
MDHRDHIESPSVERRRLLEKRMEMVANLLNQINEGDSNKEGQQEGKRKRKNDCNGIMTLRWLGQFVGALQRIFLHS